MAFVVAGVTIASSCASVLRVRSRSYAGKSSWKRAVFESEVEAVDWLRVFGRIYLYSTMIPESRVDS
jgi:hypothetical protein